jgi:hypothetical protein
MVFYKNNFYRKVSESCLLGSMLFIVAIFHSFPLEAEGAGNAQPCVAKLQNPKLKNIDCIIKFNLDKKIQRDLKGATAGMVRNAACKVRVSVTREKVFSALMNAKVLQVPRQPVNCRIITSGDPFSARFTLAPKVWFKEGKAIRAKPGMGNLLGMPPFLGKLLADWVNSSKMIESAMIHEVNKALKTGMPL